MNALKYSDTVPTVPGYYWERRSDNSVRILELHNIHDSDPLTIDMEKRYVELTATL